jgi:hypothetical protein
MTLGPALSWQSVPGNPFSVIAAKLLLKKMCTNGHDTLWGWTEQRILFSASLITGTVLRSSSRIPTLDCPTEQAANVMMYKAESNELVFVGNVWYYMSLFLSSTRVETFDANSLQHKGTQTILSIPRTRAPKYALCDGKLFQTSKEDLNTRLSVDIRGEWQNVHVFHNAETVAIICMDDDTLIWVVRFERIRVYSVVDAQVRKLHTMGTKEDELLNLLPVYGSKNRICGLVAEIIHELPFSRFEQIW